MLGGRGRDRWLWGRTALRRWVGGWYARNGAALRLTLRWGGRLAAVVVGSVVLGEAQALGWRLGGLALLGLGLTAPAWTAPHHGDPAALRFRIRHRRIAWRLGCALLYGSFAVQLAGGPAGEGLSLFLGGLAVAAVEPLVWQAWPKALRDAARRARVAERYQDAVQEATRTAAQRAAAQPGLRNPALRLGAARDPNKLADWSGPGAGGRAGFDPDQGWAGRPLPMHLAIKKRSGPPAPHVACRSGIVTLRWNEAAGELRMQHPSGEFLFPVAGRPGPTEGQTRTAVVPEFMRRHPVAEIVYYQEVLPSMASWRPAKVVLLDGEGRLLVEFVNWIGLWSDLTRVATAAGLGFARYRLPFEPDGVGLALTSRIFPWRSWAARRLSSRLALSLRRELFARSQAELQKWQQQKAAKQRKAKQQSRPGRGRQRQRQRRDQPPRKA